MILLLSGLSGRGKRNALDIQLKTSELYHPALPSRFDGFRILLMADFHIDGDNDILPIIIEQLRPLKVDLACLAGDFRNRVLGDYSKCIDMLQRVRRSISARHGIFGVRGNHDSPQMVRPLRRIGVKMLVNSATPIVEGDSQLWLIGIDDPHLYRDNDLQKAVAGIPGNEFKILLAHSPEAFIDAQRSGINVYLCGHTHGGQIVLPGIGPLHKNMRAPKEFIKGEWHYRGMCGYTSAGVGTSAVPVRFNSPPLIDLLTLRRG